MPAPVAHWVGMVRLVRLSTVQIGLVGGSVSVEGESVKDPAEIGPALHRCVEKVRGGQGAILEVFTREEPDVPLSWRLQ